LTEKKNEHRMDLILWRHADAEDATPDLMGSAAQAGLI
jgi:phosphohistidine phosphatase SixA